MIWRHVMLALSVLDSVPTNVIDRVGCIARGLPAEVELFHCLYEPDIVQPRLHGEPIDALISARVGQRHRRLERLADELRDQALTVRSSVRWDYPMYEGIVRQVLRHQPDLLIVPAIPMAEVAPRTLSYREARLIEACPCPLLLLKTPDVYSKGCVVAALDPVHAYEVPAELDEAIVAAAKTVAYALGDAAVHVYHAVAPLLQPIPGSPGVAGVEAPADARRRATHRAAAEARVLEMASRHNIPSAFVRVELGTVEASLPVFAREVRADVVVMGAVSRTYPQRALLGHTAERVLNALDGDVLVVKPRGFRCPVSPEAAPAAPLPT